MVTCTIDNGIAEIRMDDGKANAMNPTFIAAVMAALDQAQSARAVVLTGRVGFFSAGLDLKLLPTLEPAAFQAAVNAFEVMVRRVMEFPIPVVAALHGHALAGGAVLLLACDYSVAAEGAYKIGLNETAIGLPLPELVLEMARLRISPKSHMRALVHGETFSVEDAFRFGFLDEVATADMAVVKAVARAETLAKVPGPAYLATKRLLRARVLQLPQAQIAASIEAAFLHTGLRHALT